MLVEKNIEIYWIYSVQPGQKSVFKEVEKV